MQMRIGGRDIPAAGRDTIEVRNPATGDLIDTIPAGDSRDVDYAVGAAIDAFPSWSEKTRRERGMILFKAAALVRERQDSLARLLTTEQGKPIREATDEVRGFAHVLEYYAGISAVQDGEAIRLGGAGDCIVVREPLGICAAIIPWNMPVLITAWKTGPALLAGNSLILKPSSTAPLAVLRLAEIMEAAGLPPGVLNIVTGRGEETGAAIASHREIRKVSFTGSTETGEEIRRAAAGHPKEIVLEMGGSDPMIVMDDANLAAAAEGAIRGRFYNAGQICTAVKRLYVHERVADEFTKLLREKIDSLRVGNGLATKIDMGPLNSPVQRDRISAVIENLRETGNGTIVTGGSRITGKAFESGCFYRPTLVTYVQPESELVTGEVFGPVLPVMTIPDLDTAIREANSTKYHLGASVWTRDSGTIREIFSRVDAGVVWVNRHLTIPPEIPFGGNGDSGIGRENGSRALEGYTKTKTLFIGK